LSFRRFLSLFLPPRTLDVEEELLDGDRRELVELSDAELCRDRPLFGMATFRDALCEKYPLAHELR